jgi:hypothetical protein
MNLDLEITNYKIEELEQFFKLHKNYTISDVIQKEDELSNKILNSDEISKKKKNDIIAFFKEITKLLTEKLRPIIKYEEPQITHVKQEEIVLSNMNPIEKRTMTKSLCRCLLASGPLKKWKSSRLLLNRPVFRSYLMLSE